MNAVDKFRELSSEERFKGWPLEGPPSLGPKIPFFGQTVDYKLKTGNGIEDYTSILRHFGGAVVFGITVTDRGLTYDRDHPDDNWVKEGITLCQWKPGVNQASWELSPGGIGKISSNATLEEITQKTKEVYLKETGYTSDRWNYLGHIMIETGKYRGASPDDHGLKAHLFMATHLQKIGFARKPAPNEIMETLMVPLDEFKSVLDSGLFAEESAVACAYKALIKLGNLQWR